ncbi:MAG TPA: HIT domain-containing protein [Jatrophihabitans sp.]|nr:HIT domain-containing protein [Jatrophihabitans sp.]
MAEDCLFCGIVAGDVPSTAVYSDDDVIAFQDLAPRAPTHVLVIPRRHLADLGELATDQRLAGALVAGVAATADTLGLHAYRTVFNSGSEAGQTVFHVHAHLLAGRPMSWPPG